MKKKLLAVAVAGALAAPGLAMAQSSVTISGIFKTSLENNKIGSPSQAAPSLQGNGTTSAMATGRLGLNTSATRLSDDSSRILFNVAEDLGGGLSGIAQLDMRFNIEAGSLSASGNTHVGLNSKSLGKFIVGRQDLHYYNRESDLTSGAGSLRADSVSLLAYMRNGVTAIAAASRTPNIMQYTSPNFGGFTMSGAYSTGGQNDLSSNIRKGSSWNLNPNFKGSNFQVGWSYWTQKSDINATNSGGAVSLVTGLPLTGAAALAASGAPSAASLGNSITTGDQKSNRLYGSFNVAGFKLGLAWDKSRVVGSSNGVLQGERTAWSLPVSYTFGNSQIHAHYTKANNDKTLAASGAKMFAMSYQYNLSKRTSVGVTYAKITNDTAAAYNFFTTASLGNSTNTQVNAGEDPRMLAATIRHAF